MPTKLTAEQEAFRHQLIEAIEIAKGTGLHTPEDLDAYIKARNAHGDYLVSIGYRPHGRARPASKAGLRQQAARKQQR